MDGNKRQTKSDAILHFAYQLCMEKGYSNTKIIDIARAAGIGKSTVYEYFESKDAIFTALCEQQLTRYKALALESQRSCAHMSWREHLKSLLAQEIDNMSTHLDQVLPPESTANATSVFQPSPVMGFHLEMFKYEAFQKPFLALIRFRCQLFLSIIQKGIDLGEFRVFPPPLIMASLSGAISNYAMMKNHSFASSALPGMNPIDCSTDTYLDFLLDGITLHKKEKEEFQHKTKNE